MQCDEIFFGFIVYSKEMLFLCISKFEKLLISGYYE